MKAKMATVTQTYDSSYSPLQMDVTLPTISSSTSDENPEDVQIKLSNPIASRSKVTSRKLRSLDTCNRHSSDGFFIMGHVADDAH